MESVFNRESSTLGIRGGIWCKGWTFVWKKLFTNASLDYNFDKINKSDYEKMLDNIVSRMDKRADKLAEMIDAHAIKR